MSEAIQPAIKPLVYVAGPITGNPWGCVHQATEAFAWLRRCGCIPFLPQLSVLHEMVDPQDYETWLSYDFDVIRRCDALLRLPGESAGADREVELAQALGLPVFVGRNENQVHIWACRFMADRRIEADAADHPPP